MRPLSPISPSSPNHPPIDDGVFHIAKKNYYYQLAELTFELCQVARATQSSAASFIGPPKNKTIQNALPQNTSRVQTEIHETKASPFSYYQDTPTLILSGSPKLVAATACGRHRPGWGRGGPHRVARLGTAPPGPAPGAASSRTSCIMMPMPRSCGGPAKPGSPGPFSHAGAGNGM